MVIIYQQGRSIIIDCFVQRERSQAANKPAVRARVAELQGRAAEKTVIDIAWVMGKLVEIAGLPLDAEDVKTADRLRALDMVVKIRGDYAPEKREIGLMLDKRLSEMSLEELRALNQRLASTEEGEAEQQQQEQQVH